VNSEFAEINAYIYHSARGFVLDCVIWCLAPYIDESRGYGRLRCQLARMTRALVRRVWVARIND
jgi:hypothetical protein